MPAAKIISGSVVPATSRARRTGSEVFRTQVPDKGSGAIAPNRSEHRISLETIHGFQARQGTGSTSRRSAYRSCAVLKIALGDGSIDHGAQLAPQRIGARGQHLSH